MFLEPSVNDLTLEIDVSLSTDLDWIKTIAILRSSFLEIHPNVSAEIKKHFPDISSVEEKLIFNGGRGVLKDENIEKLLTYAKLANKETIFILSTFNKCDYWTRLAKKILNISSKDININMGADPKCGATYSRQPLSGFRVYITDVNGLNRMVSSEFFNGTLFGNKIDLMIIDKFFQTLLLTPKCVTSEIYPTVFIDNVYLSKNFDSMQCFEHIAWTEEQFLAIKEINKMFEQYSHTIDVSETIKVLQEVNFILS